MPASLSGVFNLQVLTSTGAPAASYRLYTFTQGTTTHKIAFTEPGGTISHAYTSDGIGGLYIALNSRGELPSPLFLTAGPYDIALKTPAGATEWTRYARGQDDAAATMAAALLADLAAAGASTGAAKVGFLAAGTGATARTAQDKSRDLISVFDFMSSAQIADVKAGTKTLDVTAAFQVAVNAGARWVPDGTYLISAKINLPSATSLWFAAKSYIAAGANGITLFGTTGFTSSVKLFDPHILGNGKTGVTGIKFSNVQFDSVIRNANIYQCSIGIILDTVCIGVGIENPTTYQVENGIQILTTGGQCNANMILNPAVDNAVVNGGTGIGTGIYIAGGTNSVRDGFVQGFVYGIYESGIYSKIDGVYVEDCSNCAVYLASSQFTSITDLFFYGYHASGALARYAIVGNNASSVTILYPKMDNGNSTGGLYFFSAGNTGCVEARRPAAGTTNLTLGVMTQLSSLTITDASATFTPTVEGATTPGACTYVTRSGKYVRTGNVVRFTINLSWTGHTGTGNIIISGFPIAALASFADETFQVIPSGFAVTGPHVRGYFSSISPFMQIIQVSAAGAGTAVALPAVGALIISGAYFVG